jgi:predicted transposase/invertase (TIGR01784 family)
VITNEPPTRNKKKKKERLDINCVTDHNEQIEVEMQAEPMEMDSAANLHKNTCDRSLYYGSDLHGAQDGEGVPYSKLKKTYNIMITNFTVWENRAGYIHRNTMRREDGVKLSDGLTIVFVELTKFQGHETQTGQRDDAPGDVDMVPRVR